MLLTKFSLRRQITLLMIYGVILFFSFFSFSQLKIDFFPDITFPFAGVITSYSGVGPEDIENLITENCLLFLFLKRLIHLSKGEVRMRAAFLPLHKCV
ncbi:MAG: efflux RND transporter permease subunit, partial [Ignavibacteria bacterium]|nr:efflux RND transporter permease subunit [Ignavibacteria bacterium]